MITYENKILEAKLTSLVNENISLRSLMTVDTSLVGSAGLTKTVNRYSYNGKVVTVLRYGEKTVISGRLRRLDVRVLAALTGCPVETTDYRNTLCLGGGSDERREVSALLVCPLPDGDEFAVMAHGAAVSGIDMRLDMSRDSAASFEIISSGEGSSLSISCGGVG